MPDILTLLVALYGALLSTVLGIRELGKDRRQVRITCRMAVAPSPTGDLWQFVSVEAVNTGHRPIQMVSAGILMSNGNMYTQLKSNAGRMPLPKKLEDGDRVAVLFDYPEIEKTLKKQDAPNVFFTKVVMQDAEGKAYTSRLPKMLKERKLAK